MQRGDGAHFDPVLDTPIPVRDPLMLERLKADSRALYEEFRATPVGKHTPNLQFILQLFRGAPVPGKYALVAVEPHRRWVLAQMTGRRGDPVVTYPDVTFTDLAEAERVVYRLRWKQLTGETIEP